MPGSGARLRGSIHVLETLSAGCAVRTLGLDKKLC